MGEGDTHIPSVIVVLRSLFLSSFSEFNASCLPVNSTNQGNIIVLQVGQWRMVLERQQH